MNDAILGIDLGSSRIGVAIAETVDLPATPLMTLRHVNRDEDARAVAELAHQRGAGTIVVGFPLRLDGSTGPSTERVDRFINALVEHFEGGVERVDERLTTAAAAKRLMGGALRGSKQRRVVDQVAAVEILDTFLRAMRRRRGDGMP